MADDWNSSLDDALAHARQSAAEEDSRKAASDLDQAERNSIAQNQCREVFERAAEALAKNGVAPDSSYRIAKPRFFWMNPTYLDGWHLWINGVSQVWLAVDGRAWPGRERVEFWNKHLPFIALKPGTRPTYLPHPATDAPWDIVRGPKIDEEGDLVVSVGGGGNAPPKYMKLQDVVVGAVAQLIANEGTA